jgi:two-component system chemotaxis response regulator CheB
MVGAQAALVEAALWTAVRALEEKAQLSRRLEERSRKRGLKRLAERYAEAVQSAEFGSSSIRHLLLNGAADPVVNESAGASGEPAEWRAEVSGMERR